MAYSIGKQRNERGIYQWCVYCSITQTWEFTKGKRAAIKLLNHLKLNGFKIN